MIKIDGTKEIVLLGPITCKNCVWRILILKLDNDSFFGQAFIRCKSTKTYTASDHPRETGSFFLLSLLLIRFHGISLAILTGIHKHGIFGGDLLAE